MLQLIDHVQYCIKGEVRREITAYSRYMSQDAAIRRVKRNYLERLDVQIDTVLKEYTQ